MAEIATYKVATQDRPSVLTGAATPFRRKFTLAAGNQNDTVSLVDIPQYAVLRDIAVNVSGTLGASCTLTAKRGSTSLTAATTAAGASRVTQSVTDTPNTSATEDTFLLTIGGADVAATAVVTVDANIVRLPASGTY